MLNRSKMTTSMMKILIYQDSQVSRESVMLFWFLIWLLPSSLVCTQLYEDNTIVRRFPVFSIALLMSHVQTKIPQRTDGRAGRLLGDRSFSTDSAVQSYPYLNTDVDIMSRFKHEEVFVLDAGGKPMYCCVDNIGGMLH